MRSRAIANAFRHHQPLADEGAPIFPGRHGVPVQVPRLIRLLGLQNRGETPQLMDCDLGHGLLMALPFFHHRPVIDGG